MSVRLRQLDRGTDVVAIRVRRSVTAAWVAATAAGVLGSWPADVVFAIAFWTWALIAGIWLWRRPRTSPLVNSLVRWPVHRRGADRSSVRRTRVSGRKL